jgi:hypothetical protein
MTTITGGPSVLDLELADLAAKERKYDRKGLLLEIQAIANQGDCTVCYAPVRSDGCLCNKVRDTKVVILSDAVQRLKRVVQEKTNWVVRFALVVVALAAVVITVMPRTSPTEANMADRTADVQAALTDVAAAQEAAFAARGSYTGDAASLNHFGARWNTEIPVAVASADPRGYCLQATPVGSDTTWRFSSLRGIAEPGTC